MSSVDYWAKVENFVQKIVSLIFHNDFFVFCWCCGKAVDKVVGLRGLARGVWLLLVRRSNASSDYKQKPAKVGRLSLLSCVAVSGI